MKNINPCYPARLIRCVFVIALLVLTSRSFAASYSVAPANFNATYLASIANNPGDEIVLDDGLYSNAGLVTLNKNGSSSAQITIRAANPGRAIFSGTTGLIVSGSNVVVRDILWDSCYPSPASPQSGLILVFSQANDCRVTECSFVNCGDPASTSNGIVSIRSGSSRIRVDHNLFQGSRSISVLFRVRGDGDSTSSGRWHWVDHNYFKDISRLQSNGQELIQIGQDPATYGDIDMQVMVEGNLCENTAGDTELISSKSSSNWIRFNTFRHCFSDDPTGLTIRGGMNSVVDGNFLIETSHGLKVWGQNHVVTNNHIERTMNTFSSKLISPSTISPQRPHYVGGINLTAGTGISPWSNQPVATHTLVAYNTVVDSTHTTDARYPSANTNPAVGDGIALGSDIGRVDNNQPEGQRSYGPRSNFFYNNLVVGAEGVLFRDAFSVDNTWSGNKYFASGTATVGVSHSGITAAGSDPLDRANTPYRLLSGSAPINAAVTAFAVPKDMDGQSRSDGQPDVGADEYWSSVTAKTNYVLQAADVGPLWAGRSASAADSTVNWGPSTLSAIALGPNRCYLEWNDNFTTETGFEIRSRTSDGFWRIIATFPANTTNASVENLSPNTTYSYQVRALGGNGSAWSPVASDTTPSEYAESSGSVTVEAENYTSLFAGLSSTYSAWTTQATTAGFVGIGHLTASSQTGTPVWADAPGANYAFRFQTSGTYKVWVRCFAASTSNDSFRWGWNGVERSNATWGADILTVNAWTWIQLGTVTVSSLDLSTPQILNLRRRERSTIVDRIYLTTGATDPSSIASGMRGSRLLLSPTKDSSDFPKTGALMRWS